MYTDPLIAGTNRKA